MSYISSMSDSDFERWYSELEALLSEVGRPGNRTAEGYERAAGFFKERPEWLGRTGSGAERWHGTTNGYAYHKCRCPTCREAWAKQQQVGKERRAASVPDRVHGTENGYGNYSCRCDACSTAWTEARKARHLARWPR